MRGSRVEGVEEMKAKGHGRVLAGARLTDGRGV